MAEQRQTPVIISLLRAFEWFDEGLQRSMQARGWPPLTRAESMVMIHVVQDMIRPSDIARNLGQTRQAVHRTIGNIAEKGLFTLEPDPDDGRGIIIVLTEQGNAMRRDAQRIVHLLQDQLESRIGKGRVARMVDAVLEEWGDAVVLGRDDRPQTDAVATGMKVRAARKKRA